MPPDLLPRKIEQALRKVAILERMVEDKTRSIFVAYEKLKQANETLEKRNRDLEAAYQELESFSYSVSHDLRAPLRSIDGFSQAVLEDYADRLDDRGKEYLQCLRSASQRMGRLIDDILNLSRVTRTDMRWEEVDLSALALVIATELQKSRPDRPATFLIAPEIVVQGDPRLLRLVLENLLGNAWKFTSKHPTATIEFAATSREGETAYFVRDDGAGFDAGYAGKLFEPFHRLHTETEFPGTGIGLATVQRILLRHGGRIWAEGGVEQGATFTFTLKNCLKSQSPNPESQENPKTQI